MWSVLASFAALVAVVLVMRLMGRPRTPPAPPPPPLQGAPPDPSWLDRPRPGDIWRATRTGTPVRCLVVRTYPETVDVLELTGDRADPTAILLPDSAFTEREGVAEPELWARVQRDHRTGYSP